MSNIYWLIYRDMQQGMEFLGGTIVMAKNRKAAEEAAWKLHGVPQNTDNVYQVMTSNSGPSRFMDRVLTSEEMLEAAAISLWLPKVGQAPTGNREALVLH